MTKVPTAVSHRRRDNNTVNMPITPGTPTTRAITTSGRILAVTIRLAPMPSSSPTAVPTSRALVSNRGRGSGITL